MPISTTFLPSSTAPFIFVMGVSISCSRSFMSRVAS
jgi:hypothetical protein